MIHRDPPPTDSNLPTPDFSTRLLDAPGQYVLWKNTSQTSALSTAVPEGATNNDHVVSTGTLFERLQRRAALRSPSTTPLQETVSASSARDAANMDVSADEDCDNHDSLHVCYIGSFKSIGANTRTAFHYAFGGDTTENIAREVRTTLPPNNQVLQALLNHWAIEGDIHGDDGEEGSVSADGDERGEERLTAREKFVKKFCDELMPNADGTNTSMLDIGDYVANIGPDSSASGPNLKWDMLQLYHHGSIKNVPYFDRRSQRFTSEGLKQQLQETAFGFFASSAGTKFHVDPLILEALAKLAEGSSIESNVSVDCRVVHLGYPTRPSRNTFHASFERLNATHVLMYYFGATGTDSRYEASLVPYVEHTQPPASRPDPAEGVSPSEPSPGADAGNDRPQMPLPALPPPSNAPVPEEDGDGPERNLTEEFNSSQV